MTLGACAGLPKAVFYPERGESPDAALALCRRCGVRDECLAFALERNEQFGIWGGLTERERRRRRRRVALLQPTDHRLTGRRKLG